MLKEHNPSNSDSRRHERSVFRRGDDGEFDDLYGDPPPPSPLTVKQTKRTNETPAAQPLTPGSRVSARSPAASSSVISRSYARDSLASTTTDLAVSGTQDKRRKRRGKPRRKGSQELFDVQWQSDGNVAKCGLCRSDFSLVRRKHHCRHCGRVMCSDCSSFLYFEFSQRKHRVCVSCNNQLLAEQEAYDEEMLATGEQKTMDPFENSSDDGHPSLTPAPSSSNDLQIHNRRSTLISAFGSKHGDDDEKARKKQEKKERNELKKRERLEKKGIATQVKTPVAIPSRERASSGKDKPATSLFDGADDDWFTDTPGQRRRSRDSDSEYSGSKGPGWRDQVKRNYTISAVSEQTSVLVPMASSTLTGGITGKGYISDQFRYDDVGGPGLGHDDDITVEMPRPKQESTTATYADHSTKPSRLTGHGYFSEQFKYDVGGPGLGHNDDRSIAMPRPKQQPAIVPYSYDSVETSERRSGHDYSEDSISPDQEFQPRLTFKDNLKEIFSGTNRHESIAKTRERKMKANKPRARGNDNMTLDELNPSYSSEDEPRVIAPHPATQRALYGNDADKLVVDDSPGFFDATNAEQEAQRKVEEEQQRQLESDMAWVNSSAVPPTVPAHRFSSEQESYSIVDHPSRTSNSPVESRGGSADEGAGGNTKGGFTGALKRFFGMGSKGGGKRASKPPKTPSTAVVTAPEKDIVDKAASGMPNSTVMCEPTSTVSDGLERHTVVDYYGVSHVDQVPQASFPNTIAVTKTDVENVVHSEHVGKSLGSQEVQQKPERQRRGTFDDLFESPKANVTGNTDRYDTTGGWPDRLGERTNGSEAPLGATVGVSRFDQRRSVDEADGLSFGDEQRPVQHSTQGANDPIEAWRRSAAMSLLNDSKDAAHSEPSFTWSNVRSTPGFGTASYAVPTSLQSPAYTGDDGSSFQNDTPATQQAPLGNIMDDLKRVGTAKKGQGQESVDDFFAEFEEPNDYVFDPATGGYVAARAPRYVNLPRDITQQEPIQNVVPHNTSVQSGTRDYSAASRPMASSTDHTVALEKRHGEDVGDEVADIIVDKISSLESELAALKQLIRNRKGDGGNSKLRVHDNTAKPSVRKESIFDNDSSEEDNTKTGDLYSSPARVLSKKKSKRRPSSKKNHANKRRDSFADLFEDSSNETSTLGGTTSYEALFQTGKTNGKNDESDDELPPKPAKKRSKSRRRSRRKIDDHVSAKEDSDSDSDFLSLKGRRGKKSAQGVLVKTNPVDVVPVIKPVEVQSEEDPIDALFDGSDGNDVTKLYGEDSYHEEETDSTVKSRSPSILEATDAVLAQVPTTLRTSDDEMKTISSAAATTEADGFVGSVNSGFTNPQDLVEADEDEEFSINWSKMRKTKSRRHKPHRGSSKIVSDDLASADLRVLESRPLDASPEDKGEVDEERKDAESLAPSSYLTDAASNWMSVSTLEEKDVNLSLTGTLDLSDLLQTVDEIKDSDVIIKPMDPGEDKQNSASKPVSLDGHTSIEVPAPNPNLQDVILAEESDGYKKKHRLSKRTANEKGLASPKLKADQQNATFDIFDKSGDVDFLSVSSQLDTEMYDHEGGGSDSGAGDKNSTPGDEETFSFEVKTPKKQQYGPEVRASSQEEALPPSPASSMDENLELHRYTATYAPSSVDGSLDGLEDITVGDEQPALGKAESEAFDTDWQQMQAKEKERKKKLQMKQRQAQRDKLLRKQGVSAKSLSNSDVPHGSTRSKSKNGKKKKKEKDASASTSSREKKSSSRKYRHRDKEGGDIAASSEPRSLTEL
ncbi:putative inactive serine/threonine-protein kinase slob1 [Phytophthora citrophthora]|uniref:Inactive serine/threonine-protein kinase slob1 n=1 Tax=Phytophthora citrophthora TaxID=4793 RepID=A0AAD9LRK3_9STRA|nr:putative inactive serine/threonine-protein kinase slob1 [Phytophthora citrophthora]